MSTLGVPVERDAWPVSADTWMAGDVFAEWVHMQDVRDTARMLMMLAGSLADERERYRHLAYQRDRDESIAEQRDLTMLASICKDHLKSVGYVPGA